MEEYSPSAAEGEETPVKRRRLLLGNFWESYLKLQNKTEDDDEEELTDKRSSTSKESKTESRLGRWSNKIRKVFSGWVSLELVPKEPTLIEDSSRSEPKQDVSSEQTETAATPPEVAEGPNIEEGLLAVSPDAQRRYYGHEVPETNTISNEETPEANEWEETGVDYRQSEQPEVIDRANVNDREPEQASANLPSIEQSPRYSSTEPVSEVLRRRQAIRLEKKVKKLKRETKTIKREQAEVKDQQREFAKKLDDRQKAQDRFEKVTVPKMEKARQELKKRLETASEQPAAPPVEIKQEKPEVKAVIPESFSRQVKVKSEYSPEAKQTIQPSEEIPKAETSVPSLEALPEPAITSERLYDRRREVKDLAGYQSANVGTSAFSQVSRTPVPDVPPPLIPPALPGSFSEPALAQNSQTSVPTDMYKQAAKNGFLGGVVLLVFLLLLQLLT